MEDLMNTTIKMSFFSFILIVSMLFIFACDPNTNGGSTTSTPSTSTNNNSSSGNITSSTGNTSSVTGATTMTLEAEDASFTGGTFGSDSTTHSGFSGTGYVSLSGAATDTIQWSFDLSAAATITVAVYYKNLTSAAISYYLSSTDVTASSKGFSAAAVWSSTSRDLAFTSTGTVYVKIAAKAATTSGAIVDKVVLTVTSGSGLLFTAGTGTSSSSATSSSTVTSSSTSDSSSSISSSASSSITSSAISSSYSSASSNSAASVIPDSKYNLTGYGAATTGGGSVAETDAAYAKVYNAQDLCDAVYSWYKSKTYVSDVSGKTFGGSAGVKVIEIMNDLSLGYTEIGTTVTGSTAGGMFVEHAAAKLHPVLLSTGVSKLDLKKSGGGLTIFSTNGATIKHCTLNIKGTNNIIIRNLKFDELWEWDEASKGDYDKNDWDFIDLSNGGVAYNVWIDHCTFTKAYDGIIDMKAGTYNVTVSYCKVTGDDGATNTNSWVRQQFNALESSISSYAMYNFFRTNGFSYEDMVQVEQGHDKTHLLGATELNSENATITVTFHHGYYSNVWDRNPCRLRGGQVHIYNMYFDDSAGLAAKRLRDTLVAAMSTENQTTANSTYSFNPFLNGSISTESAAVLVENSVYYDVLTPLRNNQTDVTNTTYTGKIKAVNTTYHMDNTDGSATEMTGDSTDTAVFPAAYSNGAGVMGPGQAAIIDFSWNTTLPYSITSMDNPADLKSSLTLYAGAAAITWDKTNWLKTSY
jgi:pectate lyase